MVMDREASAQEKCISILESIILSNITPLHNRLVLSLSLSLVLGTLHNNYCGSCVHVCVCVKNPLVPAVRGTGLCGTSSRLWRRSSG